MRVWIASLLFYSTIYALCEALRFIVGRYFQNSNAKNPKVCGVDIRIIILELIGTVQVCAPMFDVNAILEHYGLAGVLAEIAFIEMCNALLMRDAFADPCQLFGRYIKSKFGALTVALLLTVQFCGAYLSFLIARAFWRLQLNSAHEHYLHNDCDADLTVTIMYGSLVEAGGLIALKLADLALENSIFDESALRALSALASGIVTVLGIGLTGMYANPIVAWACTFNCGNVSHLAHFFVYWVAPLGAWLFADRFVSPAT